MDFKTLAKNIFVYFLDNIKSKLYASILDGNNIIMRHLNQPIPQTDTPLWMISGGEAINYYSSVQDKTPTKDIDCKLLFTGSYNIPKEFFKLLPDNILKLKQQINRHSKQTIFEKNHGYNFLNPHLDYIDTYVTLYQEEWDKHVEKLNNIQQQRILIAAIQSRQDILYNCMTSLSMNNSQFNGGHLRYIFENKSADINLTGIKEHVENTMDEWIPLEMDLKNGNGKQKIEVKIYMFKTPFITLQSQFNEEAFPYCCNSGEITHEQLQYLQNRLDAFYMNTRHNGIWNSYYRILTLTTFGRYLYSLTNVCILYERNGRMTAITEGVLDLFMDFSASDSPPGKYLYENKSTNGTIPNIIKKIDYCNKIGYIKIPTLNWLIYDQTRMLYHSLRLQEVSHDGWSEKGVINWKSFPPGRQEKYFSKLKGLLNTYLNVLTQVETMYGSETNEDIVKHLQNCMSETDCMPSDFLSYVYASIISSELINPEQILCNTEPQSQRHNQRVIDYTPIDNNTKNAPPPPPQSQPRSRWIPNYPGR